jgi:thymidylate kinase
LRRVGRPTAKTPPKSVFELSGQHTMFEDDQLDAMDARTLEFHRRVREFFRQLPELYPKPVVVIDASGTADEVYQRLLEALERADY